MWVTYLEGFAIGIDLPLPVCVSELISLSAGDLPICSPLSRCGALIDTGLFVPFSLHAFSLFPVMVKARA
jgi:hypothetical protein